MEDSIHSLAFGHRDITMTEEVGVEDDAPDGALLTAAEAVEQHILRPNARVGGDDREVDPRPPSIWQQRRQQRLRNGRDFVRPMLGFGDDADDERAEGRADGERDSEGEEESDEEEPARGYRRRNPYISDQCGVSKKRRE